jgi:hypothetical protein
MLPLHYLFLQLYLAPNSHCSTSLSSPLVNAVYLADTRTLTFLLQVIG